MRNIGNKWHFIGLIIGGYLGTVTPVHAQRTYVREFSTAAVLLTSGDTLQGPMRLHTNENILEMTNKQGPVTVVPAANVQIFAGLEKKDQEYVMGSSQSRSSSSLSTAISSPEPSFDASPHFISLSNKPGGSFFPANRQNIPTANSNFPLAANSNSPSGGSGRLIVSGASSSSPTTFRTCLVKMTESGVLAPAFCEQLTNGPVMLLCRRELHGKVKTLLFVAQPDEVQQVVAEPLLEPWSQIPSYFPGHGQKLKAFIKHNRLDSENELHVAALITYGNTLLVNNTK